LKIFKLFGLQGLQALTFNELIIELKKFNNIELQI